ncbi:MAG: hypothetical protein IJP13_04685 [Lachnospiraceae bacterium]|nr:hypothetical protein [Lachnospiraceae bacterium]
MIPSNILPMVSVAMPEWYRLVPMRPGFLIEEKDRRKKGRRPPISGKEKAYIIK